MFSGLFLTLYLVLFYFDKTQNYITSPDGTVKLKFNTSETGIPIYEVLLNEKSIIYPSELGLDLAEDRDLIEGFEIKKI